MHTNNTPSKLYLDQLIGGIRNHNQYPKNGRNWYEVLHLNSFTNMSDQIPKLNHK